MGFGNLFGWFPGLHEPVKINEGVPGTLVPQTEEIDLSAVRETYLSLVSCLLRRARLAPFLHFVFTFHAPTINPKELINIYQ